STSPHQPHSHQLPTDPPQPPFRAPDPPPPLIFFLILPRPPRSTLFPYTTLFRSTPCAPVRNASYGAANTLPLMRGCSTSGTPTSDRKSTRLNSSHVASSYAVFCLKKKNNRESRATLGPESAL